MNSELIRRVVILGGGTAGWMAAAMMAKRFENANLSIEVIESPNIPTVGVGEATVPGIRLLHQNLGVSEAEFIRATDATFKLGIEFKDWRFEGHTFFHPFSDFGASIGGRSFHKCWLKQQLAGRQSSLEDYCLSVHMALGGRFSQPDLDAKSSLARYNYAYHFDAGLYANFLKNYSEHRGVIHTKAEVTSVELNTEKGDVDALILGDGRRVDGDLFIDCSGFRSLILGDALEVPFKSWGDMLPCDRAIVVQTENTGGILPYTRSIAKEAGWQWRIPLERRCGNGYVYSSAYLDDASAEVALLESLDEPTISKPRILRFEAGMREVFWKKNCVALGLASGFIEPLESTSISLIQTGMEKLLQFTSDLKLDSQRIDEANRLNAMEYERVRDFIMLHYLASERSGSAFWRSFQERPVPEALRQKLEAYDHDGTTLLHEQESFLEANWMAMYNGFGRLPKQVHASVAEMDGNRLEEALVRMRSIVAEAAEYAPKHEEFLAQVHGR